MSKVPRPSKQSPNVLKKFALFNRGHVWVSGQLGSSLVLCYNLHGMCSLGRVLLSSLVVSKLQLNFTSSSSSHVLQPSIAGPGTSVTLKMISLTLPF